MKCTPAKYGWLVLLLIVNSCNPKGMKVEVEAVFVTPAVSSGSGIAVADDRIWIVGDDAEYVGESTVGNPNFNRIAWYDLAPENRIAKPVKHDLEACILGAIGKEEFLFAFGSGGISPYRDTLFAMNIDGKDKRFRRSLQPLYHAIREEAGLSEKELNIEGAALAGEKLVLFNRGNNFLVVIPWSPFLAYVTQEAPTAPPPFHIILVSLPLLNGFQVGISGACAININELLFTASLEETTDFILDGAIKGSYVGMLRLVNDTTVNLVALTPLKGKNGETMLEKLESIDVLKKNGNRISAIAVADNDDGNSKVFYLKLVTPD